MVCELLYDRTCRCPACRQRLGGLPTAVRRCPRCRRWMEPLAVWRRRRYPGLIELSPWMAVAASLTLGALLALPVFALDAEIAEGLVVAAGVVLAVFAPLFAMAAALWLRRRKAWPWLVPSGE